MTKTKTLQNKLVSNLQEKAAMLGWALMFGATLTSLVEVTDGREKVVLPTHTSPLFTDMRNSASFEGDNTLRREKENEAGAHGVIYTVVNRSQSRAAGKQ